MPTSAAGSKRARRIGRGRRRASARGFTLLELLATLFVAAMLVGLAALALPRGDDEMMKTEAQRLAALLDAARQQAAATAVPVAWVAGPEGYNFLRPSPGGWVPVGQPPLIAHAWPWLGSGVPADYQPRLASNGWQAGAVHVRVDGGGGVLGAAAGWLVFGAEPVSQPMLVQLDSDSLRLNVSSNGAQPFEVDQQR